MPKAISIKGALGFGWASFKTHWKFLLLALLFIYFLGGASNYLQKGFFKDIEPTASLIGAGMSIFLAWIYFNAMRTLLMIVDGKTPTLNELFVWDKSFITYLITSVIYGIVVVVGFVLLVVPGIYFTLRYGMYTYVIVDKKLGPFEALRESARLTDGVKWQLLGLALASFGVMLLGLMAFLVGWFVALPVIAVAYAFVYRSLVNQSGQTPVAPTSQPVAPTPSI
ncbi:MAG: DUF975 family protein [Candidatus Moraniibacteriota bacterium]